jgi:hypothetical protein
MAVPVGNSILLARSARGCHPCLRYAVLPICPGRTKKTLERVKGIEPSYSAWKSPNFPNVFIVSSDKSRPSGPLGSLQNFSQSEWPIALQVGTVRRRESNLAADAALTPDSFRDVIWKTKIRPSVLSRRARAFSVTAGCVRVDHALPLGEKPRKERQSDPPGGQKRLPEATS